MSNDIYLFWKCLSLKHTYKEANIIFQWRSLADEKSGRYHINQMIRVNIVNNDINGNLILLDTMQWRPTAYFCDILDKKCDLNAIIRGCQTKSYWETSFKIQLNLEQDEFELHRSTYMQSFFNKHTGNTFGGLWQFQKAFSFL